MTTIDDLKRKGVDSQGILGKGESQDMATANRCADCTHFDHHPVAQADGKRLGQEPCFHKDPGFPDGFCPCKVFKAARTVEEFSASILGQADAAERNILDTGSAHPHVWEGHDDRD